MNRYLILLLEKPPSRLNDNDRIFLKFNGQFSHSYRTKWFSEVPKNSFPIRCLTKKDLRKVFLE